MYIIFYQTKNGEDFSVCFSNPVEAFSLIHSCFAKEDNIISLYHAQPLDTYNFEVIIDKVFHFVKGDDGKYALTGY